MNTLGMGNALVDIMIQLKDDSLLKTLKLPKGSMTLIDRELSNSIHIQTSGFSKRKTSGGCAANTIHGLAHLDIKTAFVGKIGTDDMGRFFKKDMEVNNIYPILYNSSTDTGRAMALVSPDSERTFATFLGASVELTTDDISLDIFKGYQYFYVEGYLLQNPPLIEKSLRLARHAGLISCLDLASYNIVEEHRDELLSLIKEYVGIVFANELEAKSLTGLEPENAAEYIAGLCQTAVIKTGPKGSIIRSGNNTFKINALPSKVVDTTGAGDLYASGFLYGLSKSLGLEKCGMIGSLLASRVIEVIGAKMQESTWEWLRREIKKIEN